MAEGDVAAAVPPAPEPREEEVAIPKMTGVEDVADCAPGSESTVPGEVAAQDQDVAGSVRGSGCAAVGERAASRRSTDAGARGAAPKTARELAALAAEARLLKGAAGEHDAETGVEEPELAIVAKQETDAPEPSPPQKRSSSGPAADSGPPRKRREQSAAESTGAGAREKSPAVDPTPSKKQKPAAEYEEFSGLRISNWTIPKETWLQEIRGQGREVVPFARVRTAFDRHQMEQDRDQVLIAVLYDQAGNDEMATGEPFARLRLTDLARPQARTVELQVRRRAFHEWKHTRMGTNIRRGSIVAVMNPQLEHGKTKDGLIILRIEKQSALVKVGECPSLGTCEMKGCRNPCNSDTKERFCNEHLTRAYADKKGRIVAGGGHSSTMVKMLKVERARKFFKLPTPVAEEVDEAEAKAKEESARSATGKAAAALDDRRFWYSGAKEDYVKSIVLQRKLDGFQSSRVPVLGRGLADDDGLEIDFDMMSSDAKQKAERALQSRNLKKTREEHAAQVVAASEDQMEGMSEAVKAAIRGSMVKKEKEKHAYESAKDKAASGGRLLKDKKQAPKPMGFAELVDAFEVRRLPRRGGAPAASSSGGGSGPRRESRP